MIQRERFAVQIKSSARRELGLKPGQNWIGVMREVQNEWHAYYIAQRAPKRGWQWTFVADGSLYKPTDLRFIPDASVAAQAAVIAVAEASADERKVMASRYARFSHRCSRCGQSLGVSSVPIGGCCPRCIRRKEDGGDSETAE